MTTEVEVFGTPEQQSLQARGEALLRILKDDQRFCSHGRGIQVSDFTSLGETLELTIALAHVLGASGCEMVPTELVPEYAGALEAHGLQTDIYANYIGDVDIVDGARKLLETRSLPDDLTLRTIDKDTPARWVYALADVAIAQGVLPSAGPVLRGISRPGFGMVATDRQDQPVATTCAAMARHKDHPDHAMAQWGQLATRDDRKGQGIARMMAAHSIVHAADTLGTQRFSTGIQDGNTPSERLCTSLGLKPSGYSIVIAINLGGLSSDRLTK